MEKADTVSCKVNKTIACSAIVIGSVFFFQHQIWKKHKYLHINRLTSLRLRSISHSCAFRRYWHFRIRSRLHCLFAVACVKAVGFQSKNKWFVFAPVVVLISLYVSFLVKLFSSTSSSLISSSSAASASAFLRLSSKSS